MKVGIKPMLSYSEDFIDLLSSWYTRRWITPTPVTIIPYNTRPTLSAVQQNICFKCHLPFQAIKITEPLPPLLICAVLILSLGLALLLNGWACYQISLFHFLIRLIALRCNNGYCGFEVLINVWIFWIPSCYEIHHSAFLCFTKTLV